MNPTLKDFFLGCKECVLENPRSFYGSFSLGPFKNSQSLTIANALRRTLLTEISNIAITHVEIDGVLHEYSTIEGVRESVLDILLNFKQIVLKTSLPFTKPMYGYLNVRGPGIVRVSDLKLPPHIQYVDPDQYIATLNENGNLSLKFTISDFCNSQFPGEKQKTMPEFEKNFDLRHGSEDFSNTKMEKKANLGNSGFFISEKKKNLKNTNSLWVDPNFNPILKVNYLIENLEPIGRFQNQVIHVEIWTNGSLHPRKALYTTFDFLRNIFNKFEDMKTISLKLKSEFFESEETLMKILKTYEYDFGFYDVLSSKSLKVFSNAPRFLQESKSQNFLKKVEAGDNILEKENQILSFEKKLDDSAPFFDKKRQSLGGFTPLCQSGPKQDEFSFEKKQFLSVEKLHLPFRITHCLIQNNLLTIGHILNYSPKELQNFCGIGNFSLSLIQKKLKKMGLFLKTEKEI
jgi:DNA-directed RNA polymerase subunit alpha